MKTFTIILALLLVSSVSAIDMSCQDAITAGKLTATMNGNTAHIENTAGIAYEISLASYEMYAALTNDQVLFDSQTITVDTTADMIIDIPTCAYQIDIVCGTPLPYNPLFNDLVVAHDFSEDIPYCTPSERDINASVAVQVKEDYPKSTSYVFECVAKDFTPTSYYWYFGDGEILPASEHSDVYHTYKNGGEYTVACTATNGELWQTGTVQIDVVEPQVTVKIAPWYPKENHFVFMCEAQGFTPTDFDWEFSDGQKLYDQQVADVYHIFSQNGDFQVTCAASDDERFVTGNIVVSVDSCQDYNLAITQIEQVTNGVQVSGTLLSDTDVSGETVVVNGVSTGVLLNDWSVTINQTDNITASFVSSCLQEYTITTTIDATEQELTQQIVPVMQPVTSTNHGGANTCWPGFHKHDGKCVQDSPVLLAAQEHVEPQQSTIVTQSEPELKTQQYQGEELEPLSDEAKQSFAWLMIAIGLMALAIGIAIR